MYISCLAIVGAFFTALAASQELTKPPVQDNLDNLKQGLVNNLKVTQSSREKFRAGWMPKVCKDIANDEKRNPADFQIWKVKYNDCPEPWIMCYHRNSPSPLDALINTFGRLPVHTRDFVRHVVSIPSDGAFAYNLDGTVVFFGTTLNNLPVHIHEAAHSLDLENAYPLKPLSSSSKWLQAYDKDSAVPDPYAQSNQVENVAQNTVVATFDRNVPGGIEKVMKDSGKIKNQYTTVLNQQKEGGGLLVPGGKCRKRLPNSEAVPVGPSSRVMRARAEVEEMGERPDVSFQDKEVEVLEVVPFDTREACKGTAFT
ncbi:MAG: hypothetical protein LQ337_006347 [Flavoplaca oasis]|nr:MAG: hypothetical protein LQ337_006347 [Flavoplaca oasis]